MDKALGGRHEEEWRGTLAFPLSNGEVYELNVHLQALYPQDQTRIVSKHARRSKRGGEYLSLQDSVDAGVALLNFALVDWPATNGNPNPIGEFCTECDRWVLTDRQAKLYQVDHCRCEEPHVDGRQYPCKHPWPMLVCHYLDREVDQGRMPTDDDGDPLSATRLIIDRAEKLASGAGELSGEAEGN